jgi:hypothetical protein
MRRRVILVSIIAALGLTGGAAAAATAPAAAGSAARTTLRLDGIGPLTLGMKRSAAVRTGWLADRARGCPLAGPAAPVTYGFTGPSAPGGLRGNAEFQSGRLRTLSFTGGVRTELGVIFGGRAGRMVEKYRHAGFTVSSQFEKPLQGTFVTVKRKRRQVLGAFAKHGVIKSLGVPAVPVCE